MLFTRENLNSMLAHVKQHQQKHFQHGLGSYFVSASQFGYDTNEFSPFYPSLPLYKLTFTVKFHVETDDKSEKAPQFTEIMQPSVAC